MNAPDITVLLTVYNGMPYLVEAVRSILEQTEKNFVFSILNNGSTDGTKEYLDSLSDPRLQIRHLPENIGRTAVLNLGLEAAATEFIAVIDADDIAEPERLEAQGAYMRAHPETVLLGSDVAYIDRSGAVMEKDSFPTEHQALIDKLPLRNQFAHAACFFRTRAAKEAGGYPAEFPYAQDMGLWLNMFLRGGKAASLPRVLARIRVHPGQATKDLKLVRVRAEDNARLSEIMTHLPGISPAAVQTACLRRAGALHRLSRGKEALREAARGFWAAPLLLPFNPLLWERAARELRRRAALLRSS